MRSQPVAGPITCLMTVLAISTMLPGCGAKFASDEPGNTPPVIKAVIVPEQVVFELKVDGHDADGDKLSYVWDVDQGELDSKTERIVKWRLPSDAKSAVVKVYANDGVNESVPVTRTIKVNLRNLAPVIKKIVVPESVLAGDKIQLEAETHDADGDPLSFNWSVEVRVLSSTTAQAPTWTAPVEGAFVPVKLSVDDGINEKVVKSTTIKVVGSPLIVPGEQAAGIRLGDPFDKVKALYGEPDHRDSDSSSFSFRAMRVSGVIDGIDLVESLFVGKPNKSKTASGVGAGSDREQVEKEFGPAQEIKEYEDRIVHWYWKKGISFDYDKDSIVESIHVFKPHRWW